MKLNVTFQSTNQNMQTSFNDLTVLHDGQNGATFYPEVSEDGVLSWTNDRGLPNPEPVNIKGSPGKDGTEFVTDRTLTLKSGVLSVNTAEVVEEDNTLPVTSAAVYTTVGNINALLATI